MPEEYYNNGEPESGETPKNEETPENTGMPESTGELENTDMPDSENEDTQMVLSAGDILNDYRENVILTQNTKAVSTTLPYNFDSGSVSWASLSGIAGIQQQDFDGDGTEELLVIYVQGSELSFILYGVNNGVVEEGASASAVCDGAGAALADFSYGNRMECFIRENAGSYEIGFASNCYNVNKGDGNPAVRTSVEVYQLLGWQNVSRVSAVTIENGSAVYSDGSTGNVVGEGKDAFMNALTQTGLAGNWISNSADTLAAMDLINNPYQDLSVVPDPIEPGMSSLENGVQDLAVITSNMSAGSADLNITVDIRTAF